MTITANKYLGKDLYFVAVKLFLEDKDGKLFIFKDRFGEWDLPGGRLRTNEFNKSLKAVIDRKVKEELGSAVKCKINKPIVFMRHQRIEFSTKERVRIFAIGYQAKYLSGKIKLSSDHLKSEWVNLENFKPEKYFEGGWLKGVKDYIKIRNNLSKSNKSF